MDNIGDELAVADKEDRIQIIDPMEGKFIRNFTLEGILSVAWCYKDNSPYIVASMHTI